MSLTVQMLVEESRRMVPVRTGFLRDSLTWGVSDTGLTGYYGSNKGWEGEDPVPYFKYPEFGFGRGWAERGPQNYLRGPLQTKRGEIQDIWGPATAPAIRHPRIPSEVRGHKLEMVGGREQLYKWGKVWGDIRSLIRGPNQIVRRQARKFVFRQVGGITRQVMPPLSTAPAVQLPQIPPAMAAVAGRWGLYRGGAMMGHVQALGRGPAAIAQRQFRSQMFKSAGTFSRRFT